MGNGVSNRFNGRRQLGVRRSASPARIRVAASGMAAAGVDVLEHARESLTHFGKSIIRVSCWQFAPLCELTRFHAQVGNFLFAGGTRKPSKRFFGEHGIFFVLNYVVIDLDDPR